MVLFNVKYEIINKYIYIRRSFINEDNGKGDYESGNFMEAPYT